MTCHVLTLQLLFLFCSRWVTAFLLATSPGVQNRAQRCCPSLPRLAAYDLNTNYEWLSEQRYQNPGYVSLQWMDFNDSNRNKFDSDDNSKPLETTMPLYPLGAVYLPSTVNQTLVNVEPQNLIMARDILENNAQWKDRQFCATLRASDTGRIATVGTVLKILEAQQEYQGSDGELARIRLTCQAQGIVDIRQVVNPQAFHPENRIRKSSEYLQARVQWRPDDETTWILEGLHNEIQTMVNNFNMIKTIYQLEIGSDGFPPSTMFQLGNAMSNWSAETQFSSPVAFWEAAQEWQSVCYTIRQGKQAMLSANKNEIMIGSIRGPLKLPIHLEDLDPPTRKRVQQMEIDAQTEYFELGLDPCLDFQALLSLPTFSERILCLAGQIAKERQRLESAATQGSRAR